MCVSVCVRRNLYRTSDDVRAEYASVVANLQTTVKYANSGLSRPGCWAYPDMVTYTR